MKIRINSSLARLLVCLCTIPDIWAQTLYVPSGASGIGSSANGNVGIGTADPGSNRLSVVNSQNAVTQINVSNSNGGALSGAGLNLDGNGGSGQVYVYGSGYTGVSDWQDTMVIGMDTVLDGGLVLYSSDKVRIQNAPGIDALTVRSGHVGVGTPSPEAFLHVAGSNSSGILVDAPVVPALRLKRTNDTGATGNIDWIGATNVIGARIGINDDIGGAMQFKLGGAGTISDTKVIITGAGNVGIGTTSPSHKLAVNGAIRAKEVIVETANWADYVFSEDYRLAPLSEVEAHIKAEKHLPGIPSAAQVAEHGVSVGEMQAKLLAKIEELTLHQIAQEKQMAAQAARIEKLEAENIRLRRNP